MNSLGKILVVFVTAASLGFVAFTMSLVSGGPNWKAEMQSAELTDDFVFTITPGEKTTYAVKTRKTDQPVGSATPVMAEAVVAARKRQVEDATKEETRLNAEVARLQPIIKEIKDLIPPDKAGMAARAQFLDKLLTKISGDIQTTTQEITAKAAAIQKIQKTTEERRDEGFRLKNQLELMRTDFYVAEAQQKILEDELVRVEENQKRLERRKEQLQKQVEPYER
jgi:predicted  nucleic acid-binding Zn-ribbon protein